MEGSGFVFFLVFWGEDDCTEGVFAACRYVNYVTARGGDVGVEIDGESSEL